MSSSRIILWLWYADEQKLVERDTKRRGKGKRIEERERERGEEEGGRHVRILVVELLVNKNNY